MTVNIQAVTKEDREQILAWAKSLIDSGAECTVEISGNVSTGKDLHAAADDVMLGIYGNMPERYQNMINAGFTDEEIDRVHDIINGG